MSRAAKRIVRATPEAGAMDYRYLVTFTHVPDGAYVRVELLAVSETIARWVARQLLNPNEEWRYRSCVRLNR